MIKKNEAFHFSFVSFACYAKLWLYTQCKSNAHAHELGGEVSKNVWDGNKLNAFCRTARTALKRAFVGKRGDNLCTDRRYQ